MRSDMKKLIPGLFSGYESQRHPDAAREVKVLERVLLGSTVRIIVDPEMPEDELRILSPADNSVLSKIRDIKIQEDGSITYMAEFKKPADFVVLDLKKEPGPCGDTDIGPCPGIEGDSGCGWCENYTGGESEEG